MNTKFLIVRSIYEDSSISQRDIARNLSISLGKVNAVMKEAIDDGYIKRAENLSVTEKGIELLKSHSVDAAIIFACGLGVRLAPLTYDTPKGLIKINGERMIERQIEQLKERGINDITIMVGYLKEKFDYLIDKYNVKLIYNDEYKTKNTIATFYHAISALKNKNVYICVSDVYLSENVYHTYECEPYYLGEYLDDCTNEWAYIRNAKNEIKGVTLGGKNDYCLMGACFLTKDFTKEFIPLLEKYYAMPDTANFYWEDVLVRNFEILPTICVYKLKKGVMHEFDSLKDIKAYSDIEYGFGSEAIDFVTRALSIKPSEISDIECIKEGMTNNSYRFLYDGSQYIARVPGIGTEKFIDRKNEYDVYEVLKDKDITEEVIFYDKNTGYKIARYFEGAKALDLSDKDELREAMLMYKKLHKLPVKVNGSCDIIEKINEYLGIIEENHIIAQYEDYDVVYAKVKKILEKLSKIKRPVALCHGDPNPGNILFTDNGTRIIDFEYAGMGDPLSEIALFAVYVEYDVDKAIELYHMYSDKDDDNEKKILVYYMALGGFYNAIWTMVREALSGVEFGAFGMRNYRICKRSIDYIKNVLGEEI